MYEVELPAMTDLMKYKFTSAQDRIFNPEVKPEDRYKNWLNALPDSILLYLIIYFSIENDSMKTVVTGLAAISLIAWISLLVRKKIILRAAKNKVNT